MHIMLVGGANSPNLIKHFQIGLKQRLGSSVTFVGIFTCAKFVTLDTAMQKAMCFSWKHAISLTKLWYTTSTF